MECQKWSRKKILSFALKFSSNDFLLYLAFWHETSSNRTVYNWFVEFQRGRTFLNNEFHEGVHTHLIATNVDAVSKVIERDEILASLGIDMKHTRFYMVTWTYRNFTVGFHIMWPNPRKRSKKRSKNLTEVGQIWSTISLLKPQHRSIVWAFQCE